MILFFSQIFFFLLQNFVNFFLLKQIIIIYHVSVNVTLILLYVMS